MDEPPQLARVLDKVEEIAQPVSVFLYGSRARTDYLPRSDYEIGALIPKNRYVSRSVIQKEIGEEGYNTYPFEHEDFLEGRIDTPFQKKIYLRELVLGGKTLRGEKVIEKMKPPAIHTLDLLQLVRFELGCALSGLLAFRNRDIATASWAFSKSNLFGTRCLEVLELEKFPLTYDDIHTVSQKLELEKYAPIVLYAYRVRLGEVQALEKDLYANISYLNEYIEPKLEREFSENGNRVLLK